MKNKQNINRQENDSKNSEVLKFDLHVHSKYSPDCKSEPYDLIKQAEKIGLNGLAITDHDKVDFHRFETLQTPLLIIPGIEVSTKEGHVIGLGIIEPIAKKLDLIETVEKIKELGGETIIPHPFDFTRKGIGKSLDKLKDIAIETQNGSTFIQWFNTKAKDYAETKDLAMTGGSDSHRLKDLGMAYTTTSRQINNVDDLLETIRRKETKGEGTHLSIHEKIIRSFQIHL